AEKTLKYALDICPADADKVQLRRALANYAEVFILTGRYAEAEKVLKEHDRINSVLGDVTGQLNDKKLKGLLLYQQGHNKEAIQYLTDAYNLKEKLGKNDFDIVPIALYLGQSELKQNMTTEAIRHFHHARSLSARYNFIASGMDASRLLAKAYEQMNNTDSAYYYFQAYTSARDSIFQNERDRTVLSLSARYNAEKKEYQIKELQKEKLLQDKTIEAQQLLAEQRRQQIELITQQSEVNRLRASEQSLALQNRNREYLQKQRELEQSQKESKLLQEVATKESQNARLLVIIIIAGLFTGAYGIYRYRQTEKMRRQLALSISELRQAQQQLIQAEKQNEAQNIRQRISRDIHDEVGATLSGVLLFSEIARQRIDTQTNREAGKYLDHIYSNSKDMLEKMSDIVWAINPKNDSFEKIIFKLKTYARDLCSGKGITVHFRIGDTLSQYSTSMQTRKNIYLLIKEALNNAVKYSMADNIYFTMNNDNGYLQIEIRDDGKGFEIKALAPGNGISNMQARANELGSDLSIVTSPGKGTCISLQFQFHPIEVQNALPV
ncbi:MAG TPA: ATP-binding protein, partial [Chitinophagaceae bacterium]